MAAEIEIRKRRSIHLPAFFFLCTGNVAQTRCGEQVLADTIIVEPEATSSPAAAVVVNEESALQPRTKKRRKTKDPEILLEGDLLENTPKMVGLVWSSLALNTLYLLQVTHPFVCPCVCVCVCVCVCLVSDRSTLPAYHKGGGV